LSKKNKIFDAKILLFGEYTVIYKSQALTIPYTFFNGHLSFLGENKYTNQNKALNSNKLLNKYCNYLFDNKESELFPELNVDLFRKEIDQGLYFESNIPEGYGVGSSGALVAAVYDRYRKKITNETENLLELKGYFAAMESYFHGTSSGMDPLNCYVGQPLLFHHNDMVEKVNVPSSTNNSKGAVFLLDTKKSGSTEPLVNSFMKQAKQREFHEMIINQMIPLNNQCIEKILDGDIIHFFESLKELSELQFRYFREMIPENFLQLWQQGLEKDDYYLKLCGSGGGGFLLGFTRDYKKADVFFKKSGQEIIPVFKNSKFKTSG